MFINTPQGEFKNIADYCEAIADSNEFGFDETELLLLDQLMIDSLKLSDLRGKETK